MQKISIAIVGWGNVGRGCKRALTECSDLVLTGVVRRASSLAYKDPELDDIRVVSDIAKLGWVDVVLLCVPSREVPDLRKHYQSKGYCTVDTYDDPLHVVRAKKDADLYAKSKKVVSIVSSGWDPGTDSVIRAAMRIVAPMGRSTTTFGGVKGGRSMGHTTAAKAIPGVKDAVSLTLANGRGKHKRVVYVELLPDAKQETVARAIKADTYFAGDPTEIMFVKKVSKYNTMHHEAAIERTSMQVNQTYQISGQNPEFTANIMASCARACIAARDRDAFGAYTMLELPLIDFLPGKNLAEKLEGY